MAVCCRPTGASLISSQHPTPYSPTAHMRKTTSHAPCASFLVGNRLSKNTGRALYSRLFAWESAPSQAPLNVSACMPWAKYLLCSDRSGCCCTLVETPEGRQRAAAAAGRPTFAGQCRQPRSPEQLPSVVCGAAYARVPWYCTGMFRGTAPPTSTTSDSLSGVTRMLALETSRCTTVGSMRGSVRASSPPPGARHPIPGDWPGAQPVAL